MIAELTTQATAIIVAGIATVPSVIGGFFAMRAATQGKRAAQNTDTSNGHTSGELTEENHDRLVRMEALLGEHLRDPYLHRHERHEP